MTDATAHVTTARRPLAGRLKAALILFVVFALMPPLASALNDPFYVLIGTRILAYAIAAMALDLILGYGAMVSFGHAAYLVIGTRAAHDVGTYTDNGDTVTVVPDSFDTDHGSVVINADGTFSGRIAQNQQLTINVYAFQKLLSLNILQILTDPILTAN